MKLTYYYYYYYQHTKSDIMIAKVISCYHFLQKQ